MGAGPTYLLERGLATSLRAAGHQIRCEPVRLPRGFHTEWTALLALQHQIASLVRSAMSAGERVLILSGNCGPAALGALGGLGGQDTAVLWLDAHADFNTPETSPSGFLDGMAAALSVGHCWRGVATNFHSPLPEEHLMQIGVRAVDPYECVRLERSRVHRIAGDLSDLSSRMDQLCDGVRHLYVHIDLDVIDAAELRANAYSTAGGLSVNQLTAVVRSAVSCSSFRAASITALDPALDPKRAHNVCDQLARLVAT